MSTTRSTSYPIQPEFLERSSPRAFTDTAISTAQIEQIIDAARWAPSASNKQPWHFAYALRGDANWEAFSQIPNPFNRRWSLNSAALVVLLSDREESPAKHSFDAGCAWGYLALEAHALGFATHAMAGIETELARDLLKISDRWVIEAVIAVGERGAASSLPEDLAAREVPSARKPLAEIISVGAVNR